MTLNPCSVVAILKKSCAFLHTWERALSYWNVMPVIPSHARASRYGRRCSLRRAVYLPPLMEPSIETIGPSLLPTKHPQTIWNISPSLDFPRTFFGAYFSALVWCRNTQTCCRAESFWMMDSSDQANLAQSSRVLCWYFNAHSRRFLARSLVKSVRLTARHFRIKSSCNRRRIVEVEAGILTIFCNDANGTHVLVSAAAMMCLSCASVVIRGWPWWRRLIEVLRVLRRVRKLDTVRRGICNCWPISVSVMDLLRPSIRPLSHWLSSLRRVESILLFMKGLLTIWNWAKIYGRRL